jgi:signal peptidase I
MKLIEISLDTLMVFQPKLFYVIDPNNDFIEPVKLERGDIAVYNSLNEEWDYVTGLFSCHWIKNVRIFQLEEEDSNEH